ncbi:MAG: hypothetical protein WAU57_07430 [Xanthobacteraceae bacterium]
MDKSRHMLRAMLGAAAVSLMLTVSAAAQLPMPSFSLEHDKNKTPAEIEHDKAIDKAYQSATQKIPDKTVPNDPWATVRPAAPAAAPKKKSELSRTGKQRLSEGGK